MLLAKPQQPDLFGGTKPPPLLVLIIAQVNTYPQTHPPGWWGYGYGVLYTPAVVGYTYGGGGSGPTEEDATRQFYCHLRGTLRAFPQYYTAKEESKMLREQATHGSPRPRADRDVWYSITINDVVICKDVLYGKQ